MIDLPTQFGIRLRHLRLNRWVLHRSIFYRGWDCLITLFTIPLGERKLFCKVPSGRHVKRLANLVLKSLFFDAFGRFHSTRFYGIVSHL